MDNHHRWDCAYPGVEVLPDGTFVSTPYGHWTKGESPYIVSVRFTLDELDELALNVPPNGFAALFNGRGLGGWKGLAANPPQRAKMTPDQLVTAQRTADQSMRAHWSVKDGSLVFDGHGSNLVTEQDFGDFELLVDWKIEPDGDSGIYLRGTPQVQIWDNPVGSGGLYNNEKSSSRPSVVADSPPGEWNTFRIVMIGDRVSVRLNGVCVVDNVPLENYWNRNRPIASRGPIELQAHGSKLYFRNIFIREIRDAAESEEDTPGALD
jgi:hypothetical protein